MIMISSKKIRSLVARCRTEMEIVTTLRMNKIKYSFSTEGGEFAIRIPYRKGVIRIIRENPGRMIINNPSPVPFCPAANQNYMEV